MMEAKTVVPLIPLGTDMFQAPQWVPGPSHRTEPWTCCFPFYRRNFLMEEAFLSFSAANPNDQHCYSCALGPLLNKIRAPWTQALWYHSSPDAEQDGFRGTTCRARAQHRDAGCWVPGGDPGRCQSSSRHSGGCAIRNVQIAPLWKFPFNIFRPKSMSGNWNLGERNRRWGRTAVVLSGRRGSRCFRTLSGIIFTPTVW